MDEVKGKGQRSRKLTEQGTSLYSEITAKYTQKLSNIRQEIEQEFIVYLSGLCNRDEFVSLQGRLENSFSCYQRISEEFQAYLLRTRTDESERELACQQLIYQGVTDKCSQLLNQLRKDQKEPNVIGHVEQPEPTVQPKAMDHDQVTNHTHTSSSRTSRSGSSILMKQRAKLEGAKLKLEFAAKEAEIQRKKVELETKLTMLSAEKEAAVAKRELDAMYDEIDHDLSQSVRLDSKHKVPESITQDRVHRFVEEQNRQFSNSIYAKQLPLNPFANSFKPKHTNLECPAEGQEVVKPPKEIGSSQGHSNNNPLQGVSEFLIRKELLSSRLVKFDDKPESFLSWRTTFCSVMDEMRASAAEEIDLLIKWLGPQSGKHADDYARGLNLIWKRLDERYGSPELIEASLRKKLANFTKVTYREKGKLYELANILMEIQSCKASPKYEKMLGHFDTATGINPIVIKLPQNLQSKWRDRATNFKRNHDVLFPPFDCFVNFINDMSKMMNDPGFDFEAESYMKGQQPPGKPVKTTVTVRKTDTQRVPSELVDHCPIHKTRHSLNKCKAFRAKPIKERKDFLFTNGLCFRCCGSEKHLAKNCSAPVFCEICHGTNHPSALHVKWCLNRKIITSKDRETKLSVYKSSWRGARNWGRNDQSEHFILYPGLWGSVYYK